MATHAAAHIGPRELVRRNAAAGRSIDIEGVRTDWRKEWLAGFRIDLERRFEEDAVVGKRIKEQPAEELLQRVVRLHHAVGEAEGRYQPAGIASGGINFADVEWLPLDIEQLVILP